MFDMRLFYRVFHYSTAELFIYAEHLLSSYGYVVQKSHDSGEPDWLIAAPPSPDAHNGVALVAHLDTIIRKDGVELVFDGTVVRNSKGVLGADDRAGVYTILATVMNSDRRPPVIFTNHEESGGLGAKALCRDDGFLDWLAANEVKLFVELDRANERDYVYYSWECPDEVANWVEGFGFIESTGSYSDVADLTDISRIPHVNLSIGYRQQHGKSEWLSMPDMMWTQAKVWCMLHAPDVPVVVMTDDQIDGPKYTYNKWSKSYTGYGKGYSYGKDYSADVAYFPPVPPVPSGAFGTQGSCLICQSFTVCHDDWLVCQDCYEAEMAHVSSPPSKMDPVLAQIIEDDEEDWVWDPIRKDYFPLSEMVEAGHIL